MTWPGLIAFVIGLGVVAGGLAIPTIRTFVFDCFDVLWQLVRIGFWGVVTGLGWFFPRIPRWITTLYTSGIRPAAAEIWRRGRLVLGITATVGVIITLLIVVAFAFKHYHIAGWIFAFLG